MAELQTIPEMPLASLSGREADDLALNSSRTIFRKGYRKSRRNRPFDADVIWERETEVRMRDGLRLMADVFRPADHDQPIPAIVSWSPYGKAYGRHNLDQFPFRAGVAHRSVSGYQMFEGPDPAYWCGQGYAIVNVDIRGSWNSEGVLHFWGSQQASDGNDLIDWVGTRSWCNGRVGMSGNSWLAIAQWFIAATAPPHLAAIAPWEGFADFYRDVIGNGGIPDPGFTADIVGQLIGRSACENPAEKIVRDPLFSDGWQERVAKVEDIAIPAYVVASWTNFLHSAGTIDAFERLPGPNKWLRVHDNHEWADYYSRQSVADLTRFFDRYLKQVENNWEETPRYRLAVLDPGLVSPGAVAADRYPPERFEPSSLILTPDGELLTADNAALCNAVASRAFLDLVPARCEVLEFVYRFASDTDTCGPMCLRMCIEVPEGGDVDMFATVQKIDRRGRTLAARTLPLPVTGRLVTAIGKVAGNETAEIAFWDGPRGRLRASRRSRDVERSSPTRPYHRFDRDEPLQAGQIVEVEIALGPSMLRWRQGDRLVLRIAGHALYSIPLPGLSQPALAQPAMVRIHFGPGYANELTLCATSAAGTLDGGPG